jgi:hypothetical protein
VSAKSLERKSLRSDSPEAAKRLEGSPKEGLIEVMRRVSRDARKTIVQAFREGETGKADTK